MQLAAPHQTRSTIASLALLLHIIIVKHNKSLYIYLQHETEQTMNKLMKEYSARLKYSDEAWAALDYKENTGGLKCEDRPAKKSKNHVDQKKIVRRSKNYTDKDLSQFAKVLRKTTTLEKLNLGWNKITLLNKRFNQALASSNTLRKIFVIGNEIGD
jgi:hypothetical protein